MSAAAAAAAAAIVAPLSAHSFQTGLPRGATAIRRWLIVSLILLAALAGDVAVFKTTDCQLSICDVFFQRLDVCLLLVALCLN